ncbi:hypothetical protein ACP70R_001595 [Stipagrostis hirtigluma subsp. patula]
MRVADVPPLANLQPDVCCYLFTADAILKTVRDWKAVYLERKTPLVEWKRNFEKTCCLHKKLAKSCGDGMHVLQRPAGHGSKGYSAISSQPQISW